MSSSRIDEIEQRPEFVAYNQAIEDAKAAIRGEKVDDPYAAATFINAIARKCSPHVYVNRLATAPTETSDPSFRSYLAAQMKDPEFRAAYEQISAEEDAKLAAAATETSAHECRPCGYHAAVCCQCRRLLPSGSVVEISARCLKCGCTNGVDANGWCLSGRPYIANQPDSNQRSICPCKCVFPASTEQAGEQEKADL
jgi:hypothetical protein